MDMCMLDVTGVPGVQGGDVAVVYDGPRWSWGRPAGGDHPL